MACLLKFSIISMVVLLTKLAQVDSHNLVFLFFFFFTDKASSVSGLCVTPSDFKSRLGEFLEYCPVNLALHEQLIDCSTTKSLKYAAEYRYVHVNFYWGCS